MDKVCVCCESNTHAVDVVPVDMESSTARGLDTSEDFAASAAKKGIEPQVMQAPDETDGSIAAPTQPEEVNPSGKADADVKPAVEQAPAKSKDDQGLGPSDVILQPKPADVSETNARSGSEARVEDKSSTQANVPPEEVKAEQTPSEHTPPPQEQAPGKLTLWHYVRYVLMRTKDQFISVAMISGYLIIFYVVMLQEPPPLSLWFGLIAVIIGITGFMEGFMSGIMPLGELLGQGLPEKFSFLGAMITTFLLGIACTLAEPAMGALELAGAMVEVDKAPLLWYLLNAWSVPVFLAVGVGVGFAALAGTVRLLRKWPLKIMIYTSTVGTLGMTILAQLIGIDEVLGLAWDTGAVTTGAVTVPIILGLGVGILKTTRANSGSEEAENPLDSFGIVTLASLYPIMCVLLLAILCHLMISEDDMKKAGLDAKTADTGDEEDTSVLDMSPLQEIIYATRSVVPLIGLLIILIKFVMKEQLPYIRLNIREVKFMPTGGKRRLSSGQAPGLPGGHVEGKNSLEQQKDDGVVSLHCLLGVGEAYFGLTVFNIGLRYGQGPLGEAVGEGIPGLYNKVEGVPTSPLVENETVGIIIVVIFTFFMALVATYAEPALNAMGMTTEYLTGGAFKKSLLLFAVAVGVGAGVMLGAVRMVQEWPLAPMLYVGYAIAVALTVRCGIEYVCVAWDCAGVTTSSITVPLVLAMGVGLGEQLGVQDVFGLLAMGSVGPIVSVLIAGMYVKLKIYIWGQKDEYKGELPANPF